MSFAPVSALLAGSNDVPENASGIVGHFDGDDILVPLLTSDVPAVTDQLGVAAALARTTEGSLHVVNPATVPQQTSLEQRQTVTIGDEEALLEWAVDQITNATPRVQKRFLHTHGLLDGILHAVRTNDVDTLVVPGGSSMGRLCRNLTERLAHHVECDIVTVNGQRGYEQVPSILLAISGGPHSGLATDVAQRIAEDCDAWVDVLHVVDDDASKRDRRRAKGFVRAAYQRISRPESTSTWILEAEDVTEAIIDQSSYYGLTVVGAPTKGRLRRFISGSTNRNIRKNAQSVVLSARNNRNTETLGDT